MILFEYYSFPRLFLFPHSEVFYSYCSMIFSPLYGHTDGVTCLTFWNTIAVSGSDDHTVRLWDLKEGSCIEVLDGYFEKRIVSVCHNPRTTKQLFIACGNNIFEFDVRNLSGIVSCFSSVVICSFFYCIVVK